MGAGLSTFLLTLEVLAVAVVQPKAAAVKVEEAKGVSLIHDGAALLRVDLRTAVDVGPWAKMLLFLLFLLAAFFLPVVPLTAVVTSSLMELLTDTATFKTKQNYVTLSWIITL